MRDRLVYKHNERHYVSRTGWLRAAVLGANDGIVSVSSLVIGVAAASADTRSLLVAGVAGLVAGAMSMAAGEYVSVSSQADTERADLERERIELETHPEAEHRELAGIYEARGLSPELADEVARQLAAHDALGAHARDELGLTEAASARPILAAVASAASFAAGAALPLFTAVLAPAAMVLWWIVGVSLACLALLGVVSARAGGAPVGTAVLRVLFWGALAMGITAAVGQWFGAVG